MTALHWSVEENNSKLVKLLLENGAVTTIKSRFDETAYDIAKNAGLEDIMQMLSSINNSPNSLPSSSIPTTSNSQHIAPMNKTSKKSMSQQTNSSNNMAMIQIPMTEHQNLIQRLKTLENRVATLENHYSQQ